MERDTSFVATLDEVYCEKSRFHDFDSLLFSLLENKEIPIEVLLWFRVSCLQAIENSLQENQKGDVSELWDKLTILLESADKIGIPTNLFLPVLESILSDL